MFGEIPVNSARKFGRENCGSDNDSVAIETEPPPEVAQDREKLRGYVEALFAEGKALVEDQIVAAGEREAAPERSVSRAAPAAAPRRSPVRAVRESSQQSGRSALHNAPHNEDGLASSKQLNFLRSLGSQNGMSYG